MVNKDVYYRCTDGGEIWHGGVDLLRVKFHPIGATCRPAGATNPQNCHLIKLYTGALRCAQ